MNSHLTGTVALVTGATGGIGKATALSLSERGADASSTRYGSIATREHRRTQPAKGCPARQAHRRGEDIPMRNHQDGE